VSNETRHIRILPQTLINRIAAGEVLERPASAVKEIVENALDAGAHNISVKLEAGGKNLISISDDGSGMEKTDLELSVQRHATSKLPDEDLLNINSFGFRGEALASIGSVAKLTISSKIENSDAWKICVDGGDFGEAEPASIAFEHGTKVEVRDLFFATPARLKFMKAENTEKNQCVDVIKKIAMANPQVSFKLEIDGKPKLDLMSSNQLGRISEIIGKNFQENALEVKAEREGASLYGYCAVPTYNRGTGEEQYIYVNGRPIKDKVLLGAIKAAYKDFLGGGRFPVLVLFINIPSCDVDVNVHPAKSEVRFRDSRAVTGMLVSAIRAAINSAGHQASTTVADFALHAIQRNPAGSSSRNSYSQNSYSQNYYQPSSAAPPSTGFLPLKQPETEYDFQETGQAQQEVAPEEKFLEFPLGEAKAQLHNTYIIAEKEDGIIIVDQHAAHERLVYEGYKAQIDADKIARQPLLVPEIVALDEKRLEMILGMQEKFNRFGFEIEQFGVNEIKISQVPSLLLNVSLKQLFNDIADDLLEHGTDISLQEAFEHILETSACHNSIRAGRKLSRDEMNQLLRQMESTPHSGQCNHGRPTYVELKRADIEKLFGRR